MSNINLSYMDSVKYAKQTRFTMPMLDSPGSNASSNSSGSSSVGGEVRDHHSKDRQLKKTPPLPYRVAKALDPLIYRNTELDIWEEDRREAIHREKFRHFTFSPGDKCQVILDCGPIYHGHVQEIGDKANPVVVYIEELGEKREIPLDSLRPTKSTLRSDLLWKSWRRKSPIMPVAQLGPNIPNCPPPLAPKMVGPNIRPNNMMPLKQIQNTTHQTREVVHTGIQQNGQQSTLLKPPQPLPSSYLMSQGPPPPVHVPPMNGNLPLLNGPMPAPIHKGSAPMYSTAPQQAVVPQHVVPPPSSTEIQVVSPGGNQLYPCIWVPFMDSMSLRQVNVNMPPSQDPMGQDLPFTDTQTLRFFFNLGVEYYRSVSQMSCSMSVNSCPPQGQSGINHCQSKSNNNKHNTKQPLTQSNTKPTDPCLTSPSELDDKRSNTSADSGCESESSATVSGHPSNNKNDGSMTLLKESVATVKSVSNESNLEKISACSDMSVSESNEGSIIHEQDQQPGRQMKHRRKYYMYGDLKLVKPIKDIPKRFLNMLAATSAERARCEGEPIILASPATPPGGEHFVENQNSQYMNNSGHQTSLDNSSVSSEGCSTSCNGQALVSSVDSQLSACQTNYQALYIPPQSSLSNVQTPACSTGDSFTNTSCNQPPFYTGYSNTSFPQQMGTVYFTDQTCPQGIPSGYTTYSPGIGPLSGSTGPHHPGTQQALTYSVSHQVSSQVAIAASQ
ncbi:uncharacterized protein LOC117329970 [Pecten maximus]|uniref:uncharacterized protein LOC117329970 n=1 Tax=Pecten maximus TaxID=6579 RepID=UPI001458AD24|nr:uncharacterized protein LOC117329970 [Pecten maximus]